MNQERFSRYVNKSECWEWMGARLSVGYGIFQWKTETRSITRTAHRCAYELAYGPIPNGMMVLHRCDNRACVRPDHLYLGTHRQNMRDMVTRERAATGERNAKRLYPERTPRGDAHHARQHPEKLARGAANGNAKYTPEIAAAIRSRRKSGAKLREIAEEFGVPIGTVHQITSGKTWRE